MDVFNIKIKNRVYNNLLEARKDLIYEIMNTHDPIRREHLKKKLYFLELLIKGLPESRNGN